MRALVLGTIVSVCLDSAFFVAEWWAVSPYGSVAGLWFVLLLAFPILAAVLTAPIALLLSIPKRTRRRALQTAIFTVAYAVIAITSIRLANHVRMHAFAKLAERSTPLVEAVAKFETERGQPPSALGELVPEYLPAIPATGMAAYPKYKYERATTNDTFWWGAWPDGNTWVLYVETPSGGINWDRFLYFPKGSYPKRDYSSWLERVGEWVYAHE